jgi:hypothetical protein
MVKKKKKKRKKKQSRDEEGLNLDLEGLESVEEKRWVTDEVKVSGSLRTSCSPLAGRIDMLFTSANAVCHGMQLVLCQGHQARQAAEQIVLFISNSDSVTSTGNTKGSLGWSHQLILRRLDRDTRFPPSLGVR